MKKSLSLLLLIFSLFSGLGIYANEWQEDCASVLKTKAVFPLNAQLTIENQWPTGYQALVTLQNPTSVATTSWQAFFVLPAGQMITSLWNGVKSVSGDKVVVTNPTWYGGGVIPGNSSTTFGMIVSKPANSNGVITGLTAFANGNTPIPPTIPQAPTLNPITVNGTTSSNYTVSWNSVANATSYTLQESTTSSFTNPIVVAQGNVLSRAFTNKPNGTYYYRVAASNSAGMSAYSNVQFITVNNAPAQLNPPVAQPINNPSASSQFQLQWSAVTGAQTYTVQQSLTSNFASFTTAFSGNATSAMISVSASGTYYYRVIASAANVTSAPSNVVNTTVTITNPPTSNWIIDGYWESWAPQNPPVSAIVNMHVDVINISFANFTSTGPDSYVIAGVESDPTPLITAAHGVNKKVKIAVGGATYPLQPQLQSDADARGMAQAVANYVTANNLDGVDWDIEDYPAPALQVALLRYTRELLPNKLQTYTPKSPASTTYPYNEVIRNGHQYMDYLSIMAYDYAPGYRYQDDVRALIAMGVPASKIVVGLMPGLDDLGVMTSVADIQTAAQFIKDNNLKGIMFWDLNRDYLNITGLGASAATNTAWTVFNQ